MTEFEKELTTLINCHSMEIGSHTPDYILAAYLVACLVAWNTSTQERERWYGRNSEKAEPPSNAVIPGFPDSVNSPEPKG